MIKRLVITLMTLSVFACASTEPTSSIKYYVLDAHPAPIRQSLSDYLIQVLPISVPQYLDQPNLVLRESDQKMRIASYHSWADNLADSIQRVLVNELNRKNTDFSMAYECKDCAALGVLIEHFYPTANGDVVLSGSYTLDVGHGTPHRSHFFFTKALAADGYSEAVKQMRQLLEELAEQLSGDLSLKLALNKNK